MIPLIITLVGELPQIMEAAVKIKGMLSADGSNFLLQLHAIQISAMKSADETVSMIADWEKTHHMPAVVKP